MLLSARILTDVASVNSYRHSDVAQFTQGDQLTIYFQLVDMSVDKDLRPAGRRYVPASGATLSVVIHSIDDAKTVTRFATQPYATDPSIWALSITSTDQMKGTCSLKLTLTQSSVVTRGLAQNVLSVEAQTQAM